MTTTTTLHDARALLRISAHVATHRDSTGSLVLIVTPVGYCRQRLIDAANQHDWHLTPIDGDTRVAVFAHDDTEAARLLAILHDAIFPALEGSTR